MHLDTSGWTGHVRVSSAPLITVARLMIEAVSALTRSPGSWWEPVRAALEPSDHIVLEPLSGPGARFLPDGLLPLPEASSSPFELQLDQVTALAEEDLVGALARAKLLDSRSWRAVASSPRRWLEAYAASLRRAWTPLQPLWERTAPLVEREFERIGVALARGAFDTMLAEAEPLDHQGTLHRPAELGSRLVLIPTIASTMASCWHRDASGHIDGVAYLLPGVDRLAGPDGLGRPNTVSGLDALVGKPRADILRCLDSALTAGRIARDMHYTPSVITHHLAALERADLVVRERHGRLVLVRRSARGTALLRLYEHDVLIAERE